MNPDELLINISEILQDLKIPYAITGGFAVTIWGKPRYTADIDVIVEMADRNIKPLAKKLLAIDKNVYADEDMIREDLILSKLMWSKESESQKQAEDIKSVLRNPNMALDMKYLKNWAQKHDTLDMLEELIEQVRLEK